MSITNDELILFILFVDVFRCYIYLLVKVFPYSFISENGILTNEVLNVPTTRVSEISRFSR